jgi:hypothetical protein
VNQLITCREINQKMKTTRCRKKEHIDRIDNEKCCHKKRWRRVYSVFAVGSKKGGTKNIVCDICKKRWEVPLTADEKRLWRERIKQENSRSKDLHALYRAFQKAFYQDNQKGRVGWKYKGYELMKRIEEFAKKHPELVLLSCDDSWYTSSMIVLIPHRIDIDIEYWGTTVVIVPQCTGEPPLEMFLYPGHAVELEKALHGLNCEFRRKKKTKLYWPKP